MIVSHKPELSVIIVNYFSEQKLLRCLRSIDAEPEPVEVIAVDNGSAAGGRATLAAAFPSLVWQAMGRNAGFSAASNTGAARARSTRLLFLNPDTTVLPGSIGALIRALGSGEHSSVVLGCAVRDPDGAMQLSCRRFPDWRAFFAGRFSLLTRLFPHNSWSVGYLMRDIPHDGVRCVDWVSGAAMAMPRETFEKLRGFDEGFFMYFEDVDFCRRAAAREIPTIYFPEAAVEHQIGGSSDGVPYRSLVYRHRSMWTYYRRYHGRIWLDPFAATLIFGRLVVLVTGQILAGFAAPARDIGLRTQKSAE